MQIRSNLNALFLLLLLGAATAAEAQVQPELAKRYFEEASKLCERDAGRLWGVSLCGPLVIVDQVTGTRATSQPEPEGPPPDFRVSRRPRLVGRVAVVQHALVHAPGEGCRSTPATAASRAVPSHSARAGVHDGGRLQRASRYARRARLDAARMARAPPGDRVERERPGRGDRRALAFRREHRRLFPVRRTTNGATRFAKG